MLPPSSLHSLAVPPCPSISQSVLPYTLLSPSSPSFLLILPAILLSIYQSPCPTIFTVSVFPAMRPSVKQKPTAAKGCMQAVRRAASGYMRDGLSPLLLRLPFLSSLIGWCEGCFHSGGEEYHDSILPPLPPPHTRFLQGPSTMS